MKHSHLVPWTTCWRLCSRSVVCSIRGDPTAVLAVPAKLNATTPTNSTTITAPLLTMLLVLSLGYYTSTNYTALNRQEINIDGIYRRKWCKVRPRTLIEANECDWPGSWSRYKTEYFAQFWLLVQLCDLEHRRQWSGPMVVVGFGSK